MVDGYFGRDGVPGEGGPEALEAAPLRRGNLMARMRMAVLYDRSVTWRGLVVGTGNKTELLVGYSTQFGDSAVRLQPHRRPVQDPGRRAGGHIGVPEAIIAKPTADLWPGQTDETEAGFSYPELDRLLFWRVDKRRSVDEVVALGFERAARRAGRPDGRGRRVQAPGPARRQARPPDRRRRLPVPAAPARLGGPALTGGRVPRRGRRRARRPGGSCTSSPRRSATWATSTMRALEVLRAVPLIAAEDTRITRRLLDRYEVTTRTTSYHARSGPVEGARPAGPPRVRRRTWRS